MPTSGYSEARNRRGNGRIRIKPEIITDNKTYAIKLTTATELIILVSSASFITFFTFQYPRVPLLI
jgi:hypothetical protein